MLILPLILIDGVKNRRVNDANLTLLYREFNGQIGTSVLFSLSLYVSELLFAAQHGRAEREFIKGTEDGRD